ncbi:hypothetical protein OsJ_24063 [Oryza sativa Japonica Group]|uniref:Uncharacterized protein n=1 Tax=Oryza sativa subsp. japonica TaxID=39947 RepID=Q6Z169_ORYSJ|nr:short stature homeobox protein 2 [Oryza sativa Japonica Group]EAZ39631.1 hypothetical protein OsJ_24063 [Oryza sativa Japonica Group]BAC84274.1 hypothetical protein [Oryza sativa Japonica Group]
MVFDDYFSRRIVPLQEQPRGAWAYTGYNDQMRTYVGIGARKTRGLCDRDRESILAVMMAVGEARGRSHGGAAGGGGGNGAGSSCSAAGGSRAGGSGGGGSFRAPGPSHGVGKGPATDAKGKRKVSGSEPPSPPHGGVAEHTVDRPPTSHKRPAAAEPKRKKKRLLKIGQTEPCQRSFIEPPE